MRINFINSDGRFVPTITIKPKMKYLSGKAQENLQEVLKVMNKSSKYAESPNGRAFEADIVGSVYLEGNKEQFRITDARLLLTPVKDELQRRGISEIDMGKVNLKIDNTSGRIEEYTTPLLSTFKKAIRKIEKYLEQTSRAVLTKDDAVKFHHLGVAGLTEKGAKFLLG